MSNQRVECSVCRKLVPIAAAAMVQVQGDVAYFCSMDCYDKWRLAHPHRLAAEKIPT